MYKVHQTLCAFTFAFLTAYGQAPAKPNAKPTPIPMPAGAATPQPQAPATPATPAVSADKVKELNDALKLYQLDQLSIQQAKITFSQTDEVSKRAMEILNNALLASPEVKKATDQAETDRKALLAKIDDLRKTQGLDKTWDWDFNLGKFVKTTPEQPKPTPDKK